MIFLAVLFCWFAADVLVLMAFRVLTETNARR